MELVQLRAVAARPVEPVEPAELEHPDELGRALAGALGDPARVLTRPIDVVAYASDASVYRLVPRAVVRPGSEAHVKALLVLAHARGVPLTFRAAGTSLSGQAVGDGILVDVTRDWTHIEPLAGGARVRVQPGAIGGRVNAVLRRFGRRIGPDPASIDACMMGGILANNSSGMCCGVAENAYHTLASLRFVLPSGVVVDTAWPDAGARLAVAAPELWRGLAALRDLVRGDRALAARVRAKYRIKNTTGYALEAFLDHDSPEQILAHLMIGSEGTLGFISEAVLHTLPDLPIKRTGLFVFTSAAGAFAAVAPLAAAGARAVEYMDHACLRAVAGEAALGVDVARLPAGAAALLVEFQYEHMGACVAAEPAVATGLAAIAPIGTPELHEDPVARAALWRVRKGLYPQAGATRRPGEAVIIEDVAFPLPALPRATAALRALLDTHGYERALVFGHAKDGNVHFVITPSFDRAEDIARYDRFMRALVKLVVDHDGSLKAEHGTGRNVAPFVEREWGEPAYAIMRELKTLVDPGGVLNPGVLISADPRAHVTHLKRLPAVDAEVDRCVECGFCEPVCPSRRLTLTPRQRIAVRREQARLEAAQAGAETLASLRRDFQYAGLDTCAADGMCATVCPLHIDTGQLVKRLRGEARSPRAQRAAAWLAQRFGVLERLVRLLLRAGHLLERVVGVRALAALTRVLGRLTRTRWPTWSAAIPRVPRRAHAQPGGDFVLVPSCTTRLLGQPRGAPRPLSAEAVVLTLAARARVALALPADRAGTCCGLAFGSKGYTDAHALLLARLVDRMWTWSRGGEVPLVLDASSCLYAVRDGAALLDAEARRRLGLLQLVDVAAFVRDELLPRLTVHRLPRPVVLHPSCATRKLDGGDALLAVAERCAEHAEVPVDLGCCAMAGDRGLLYPELNASAVAPEGAELAPRGPAERYASNLTCEIGMTQATGVSYVSFLYLVEEATRPR